MIGKREAKRRYYAICEKVGFKPAPNILNGSTRGILRQIASHKRFHQMEEE